MNKSGSAKRASQPVNMLVLILGVLAIAASVFAFFEPRVAEVSLGKLVGIFILAGGLLLLKTILNITSPTGKTVGLIFLVVSLALGIWMLLHPLGAGETVTILLTVFFLIVGIAKYIIAFSLENFADRSFSILSGSIVVIVAVLMGKSLFEPSAEHLGISAGIGLLFIGALAIRAAFHLPRYI